MEPTRNNNPQITRSELIAAAIEGYEVQKARIDQKIAGLRAMLSGDQPDGSPPHAPQTEPRSPGPDRRSPTEEVGCGEGGTAPTEGPKPNQRLSAAGRRGIIEATSKRWAAVRAAKAEQEKTATKNIPTRKAAKAIAAKRAAKPSAAAEAATR